MFYFDSSRCIDRLGIYLVILWSTALRAFRRLVATLTSILVELWTQLFPLYPLIVVVFSSIVLLLCKSYQARTRVEGPPWLLRIPFILSIFYELVTDIPHNTVLAAKARRAENENWERICVSVGWDSNSYASDHIFILCVFNSGKNGSHTK